ncbi:MAG: hypothetical protein PHW91_09245 [Bacteroidales bacterium]|nr:hypothetical protein [Bacteroidales bacterium]
MTGLSKQLSNPISTGGQGIHFENRVQASFALLMLANGYSPCLHNWPIVKIKLQGKYQGYNTDDLIVFTQKLNSDTQAKLFGQVKLSISITNSSEKFGEVINAAWNDFNNKELFCEEHDIIALICSPLSATDTDGIRKLVDCALHSENENDFIDRIEKANFTSNEQRDKFSVFKYHLKKANQDNDLTTLQLWRFLKIFRLLIYDLDIKGVTLSLLHTIIEQNSKNNANSIWTQILDHVQWENGQAGCITFSTIPEEIKSVFKARKVEEIPLELIKDSTNITTQDWNDSPFANELVFMSLLGSWDENSKKDKEIASKLAQTDYNIWISKLRELLQKTDSPLVMKNGQWSLKDRKYMFQSLGSRLFDQNLDTFKECVLIVLKEFDPKFGIPEESRLTAQLQGKILSHSQSIRKGLAEGLALIGNSPTALTNCSSNKAENTIILTVRAIFENSDWILWASLNNLLPTIAEAAPNEFITIVESILQKTPSAFDDLFANEGNGITGWNYITGVLWALESLAWEEQFLVRVTVTLGELAKHDPGGSWANRPANSLVSIFLPWFPQTLASFEKRKIAILNLKKEFPDIAWKLLINLLPNKHQTSMGSHKPNWRNSVPSDWKPTVSNTEYWQQVEFYAQNVIDLSKDNISRLSEVINNLDNLPRNSFDRFLSYLDSETIKLESEDDKYELWSKLDSLITKHKRFSTAKWALSTELVTQIENVTNNYVPNDPLYLYRKLFNGRDYDLYDEKMDWQARQKQLEEQRKKALSEIIKKYDFDGVLELISKVESSRDVGYTLGMLDDYNFDSILLPAFLDNKSDKTVQFIRAFIWNKHRHIGWKWIDSIDFFDWTIDQKTQFYIYLPFTMETWGRVSKLQNYDECNYWHRVNVNPYNEGCDLNIAVDKLIFYDRPSASINCIYKSLHDKQPLNNRLIVKALISVITTKESSNTIDIYHVTELIKYLQNDKTVNSNDLFRIEWAYLQLLDGHNDARPKLLENKLATDPNFFCELIQLIYKSKNAPHSQIETTDQEKSKALNAWKLLNEWSIPPGSQTNGSFKSEDFHKWIMDVREICDKSGHLEIAQTHIGKVLFHSPPDINGFWINETIADELNKSESQILREGFCNAIFNSRGVHIVDPTGKPEMELAQKYNQQATEAESKGFYRIATSLNNLANSYEKDAERIIEQHRLDEY